MLTVVRLGFFDHTLDGIFDVVSLFLFDWLLLGHLVTRKRNCEKWLKLYLLFLVGHLNTVNTL